MSMDIIHNIGHTEKTHWIHPVQRMVDEEARQLTKLSTIQGHATKLTSVHRLCIKTPDT
jgi:hypothetical protein